MAMTPQHILKYLISSAQIWKKAFSSNAEICIRIFVFQEKKDYQYGDESEMVKNYNFFLKYKKV